MSKIKNELEKKKKALNKVYKFNIPIAIIVGIIYSFVFPKIPRKNRPPMIEEMDYSSAIIETAILFFAILFFSFYFIIRKKKKKIEDLERKLYIENKDVKKYKSASTFKN